MSTVRIWQTVSTNSADTERLGQLLGQNLHGGEVLELRSDLGGGKTTFTKGLAAGLKTSSTVSSPSFTISQIYKSGDLSIHHYDFYRLEDPGVVASQLAESLDDPDAITVVEWAKAVAHVLPQNRLVIEFKPMTISPDEREITLSYPESYAFLIEKLQNDWRQN